MKKESIELHILHEPAFTTEDNGFEIAIFIGNELKNILELSEEQILHVSSILLNATNKFITIANKNLTTK